MTISLLVVGRHRFLHGAFDIIGGHIAEPGIRDIDDFRAHVRGVAGRRGEMHVVVRRRLALVVTTCRFVQRKYEHDLVNI